MTKKHFIALADALKRTEPLPLKRPLEHEQWEMDVKVLADFCAAQNPSFMRQRWLDYIAGKCGPNGGSKP